MMYIVLWTLMLPFSMKMKIAINHFLFICIQYPIRYFYNSWGVGGKWGKGDRVQSPYDAFFSFSLRSVPVISPEVPSLRR